MKILASNYELNLVNIVEGKLSNFKEVSDSFGKFFDMECLQDCFERKANLELVKYWQTLKADKSQVMNMAKRIVD